MSPRVLGKFTAAILFAAVLSPIALAKSTTKERTRVALPFAPSEELVYEGEFSKLLLRGINIAELRFKFTRPAQATRDVQAKGDGEEPAAQPLLFTTDVVSKGFFVKLFGVSFHYHAESQVEPNEFYPLRQSKVDEQGKHVRKGETVFDQEAKRVQYTESNYMNSDPSSAQGPPRVIVVALAGPTQDVVSALYFLRTQPLTPGQTLNIAVTDSGRVFQVPATVFAEKKRMKCVLGNVPVVRVEVELFGPGRAEEQGKGKMSIWVTNDDRHLPIKGRLSSDMGQVDITLKSIKSNGN
ncbi:MAG TPA: DUF3108 domain-containing protein [Pyrinomonadaceae bacterium]|nr:DUF3108 domain-containing protein [Pyrinomonadaceae bacterium]